MPDIRLQLPTLYPKQHAALWNDAPIAVIEACTKAGKTVGCMAWLLERAYRQAKPTANRWWVAPVYQQAEVAFRRIVEMFQRARVADSLWKHNESKMWIKLAGCGTIWFKSGEKPDNLYGEDVYDAVIDEASRVREDAFSAIVSTLTATRGMLRVIGNVKGRRNWAYQLGSRARGGEQGLSYTRITADDAIAAGIIRSDTVEFFKRQLPHNLFRALYYCEPMDDGGNPFGIDAIAACVAPLSAAQPVVYGVDLAKSQDWTVIIGLDASGTVCRFDRWQAPWNMTIPRLAGIIGSTPALVDSTGVGDPILEQLTGLCRAVEGFKFTGESKQPLMEGLAAAIHQRKVCFPANEIREELDVFEYEISPSGRVRYSAPDNSHDDCVCALALAVRHFDHRPRPYLATIAGRSSASAFTDDDRLWSRLTP